MPQSTETKSRPNKPEKKIGPFPGGLGVAIWRNTIQMADGPKVRRSVTIAPRRYRDPKTGEWRDAPSFNPVDIPVIVLALEKALDYIYSTPLPDERPPEMQEVPPENDDTPF